VENMGSCGRCQMVLRGNHSVAVAGGNLVNVPVFDRPVHGYPVAPVSR